jgi:hypothetical protein
MSFTLWLPYYMVPTKHSKGAKVEISYVPYAVESNLCTVLDTVLSDSQVSY